MRCTLQSEIKELESYVELKARVSVSRQWLFFLCHYGNRLCSSFGLKSATSANSFIYCMGSVVLCLANMIYMCNLCWASPKQPNEPQL